VKIFLTFSSESACIELPAQSLTIRLMGFTFLAFSIIKLGFTTISIARQEFSSPCHLSYIPVLEILYLLENIDFREPRYPPSASNLWMPKAIFKYNFLNC
jgi:hypothetical protein